MEPEAWSLQQHGWNGQRKWARDGSLVVAQRHSLGDRSTFLQGTVKGELPMMESVWSCGHCLVAQPPWNYSYGWTCLTSGLSSHSMPLASLPLSSASGF